MAHVTNGIGHFDIFGGDTEALGGFYRDLLGWDVQSQGPGYALVRTPEGSPDGAIVEAEKADVTFGVVVADIEAAVEAVSRLGGEVLMPATDNGWVVKAQIADPAGNRLTLIQG